MSLVTDKSGIYYDPTAPSDLENLISQGPALRQDQQVRIEQLIARIISSQISKYNLSGTPIDLPDGHKILVPGQVEDDASILKGCDDIRTNLGLLKRVREDNPNSIIIYKPHPDVVAGLRLGAIDDDIITQYADITASTANISDLLSKVDAVHTITSLTGFEALLRKIPVTTYGTPFYAGWGLTTDHGSQSTRRGLHRDLNTVAHRALIDYPRYFDPITKTACPIEVALHRLENNRLPRPGPFNRVLAKLQGVFASATPFWR